MSGEGRFDKTKRGNTAKKQEWNSMLYVVYGCKMHIQLHFSAAVGDWSKSLCQLTCNNYFVAMDRLITRYEKMKMILFSFEKKELQIGSFLENSCLLQVYFTFTKSWPVSFFICNLCIFCNEGQDEENQIIFSSDDRRVFIQGFFSEIKEKHFYKFLILLIRYFVISNNS